MLLKNHINHSPFPEETDDYISPIMTESSRRYPPEETVGLCGLYGTSVAHSLLCQDKSLAQIDVLNHMGYTWDVHKDFFRKYDSVGERLEVAKLLMLPDQNKLNEYRDNGLAQIDVRQLAAAQFQGKECLSYSSLLSLFVDI